MNFSQFDGYTGLFHFSAGSPLCDFQENESLFECQVDRVGNDIYDSGWLNDDKLAPLKSVPSSPIHKESQYPQRTSLLGIKRRRLSDLSKSEPLVTKLNHFKYRDEFLLDDSKELPDVILVSPRSETTPEPKTNTSFNIDDEKTNNNLNLDFDDALRNVQVEVGKDYSIDLVTKEDVEYLDSLLSGFSDQQPMQTFDNDFLYEEDKRNIDDSDLSSFNEISCNINQQNTVGDSKSAIKTLLKNDSFKGNFCMKKSTEILSEIDQSHDCFAEHNYFSPTKILKSRIETDQTDESVAGATPSAPDFVPIVNEDYVVETAPNSLDLKTPSIVLPHCPSASKKTKVGKAQTAKKSKSKSLKDPTYKPFMGKKPLPKKSQARKPKSDNPVKTVIKQLKFPGDCDVAKLPRIPLKSSVCESKSTSRVAVIKPRMVEPAAPRVLPTSQFNYKLEKRDDPVPVLEEDPIDMANPSTPLASPTRDDIAGQDEFTIQDFSRPETPNSNVDCEPPVPKIEKKKISLKEYLKKRGTDIKTESENNSAEPATPAFVPNVEEILKTIVKSEPPPVDEILKSIIKTELAPVKSEPPVDEILKSAVKTEPALVKTEPIPTKPAKSKPSIEHSLKPAMISEPAPVNKSLKPVVKLEHRSKINLPVPKPRPNPAAESKQTKETQNNPPFKLIKLSIPDKAPSVRSISLSPNEVSQSLDSCDRYSSSGVSSYHNSSVSSTCGSPFTIHDDKSNDTKDSDSDRIAITKIKTETMEKKLQIPFAVDEELLRKDGHSSRRHKRRKDKRRRSGSISRKRKNSDSCFEEDSDWSDYSDKRRSRKRYISSSSSSSEKSHHHRSHTSECSISPRSYRDFCDWKYSQPDIVPEPYFYPNYNELPNMYYPAPPPVVWHPDFGPFYPPFVPSMEAPYFFNGSHEPPMDTGEMEIDRRALFVGNIESSLDEKEFKKRFEKYGTITHVKLHFRENLSNYGFVYFTEERYVQRAIEHGSDDPDLPHYKLGVGIRKDRYADRRAAKYEKNPVPSYPNHSYRDDPFNMKLEEFRNDLRKKKLDGRK